MNSRSDGPGNQANEKKLVLRAQKGDSEAFGVLYSWYLDAFYRYVYFRVDTTATAEDLTEEVFVRAWEALPTYEIRKYPFKSWLYRIAHNLVIDHRRKQQPVAVVHGHTFPQVIAGILLGMIISYIVYIILYI